MRKELKELKKELIAKKINWAMIGIDELPRFEGLCFFDCHESFEIFYFERGSKFDIQYFDDLQKAITHFKKAILDDPSFRLIR